MSVFRWDDERSPAQRAAALAKQAAALARLPRPVRSFYLHALRVARQRGDQWSLDVATRPHELREILALAEGKRSVVEIGTATGWTALSLSLGDPSRTVTSYDPVVREHRDAYQQLSGARVEFVTASGDQPRGPDAVDFLFIDGEHTEAATAAAFAAWRDRLVPGAVVAFHDYGDPAYPGVADAVRALGLHGGKVHGRIYAWQAGA